MSIDLNVRLLICLDTSITVCLPVRWSGCPLILLAFYLLFHFITYSMMSVCLSICPTAQQSIYLTMCLSDMYSHHHLKAFTRDHMTVVVVMNLLQCCDTHLSFCFSGIRSISSSFNITEADTIASILL